LLEFRGECMSGVEGFFGVKCLVHHEMPQADVK